MILILLCLLSLHVDASKDVEYWVEQVESVEPWWPTERVSKNCTDIIFVKTHKTAGSTVTSILHRYCAEYDHINCYVPNGTGGSVTRPSQKESSLHMYNPTRVQVHAQHTYYWPKFLHKLVSESAPIITIIRQPASRFLSTWDYRKFSWKGRDDVVNIVRSLSSDRDKLPANFLKLVNHDSAHTELCPTQPDWAISNKTEPSCVQTLRDIISGKLALVLITERLDESLVLLSRMMGWSLHSVVYSSMKVSGHKTEHNQPDTDIMSKIENWLEEDRLLYQISNILLDRRIESQDATFWSDLIEFQRLKEVAQRDCFASHHEKVEFNEVACKALRQDNIAWVSTEHQRVKDFLEDRRKELATQTNRKDKLQRTMAVRKRKQVMKK